MPQGIGDEARLVPENMVLGSGIDLKQQQEFIQIRGFFVVLPDRQRPVPGGSDRRALAEERIRLIEKQDPVMRLRLRKNPLKVFFGLSYIF